ncbi:MAG: GIY-YIG nuclease family protein [Dehalococcoidia bacterium]|nr:GIY-YIG nuclease family protein [Dehalococcoidia bacterium]
MPFFVYLLRCADGSYYAGHTENLESRLASHQGGLVPGCTRPRRPVSLVWVEETSSRADALQVERQIKGWSRVKKELLIDCGWEALRGSSRGGSPCVS